MPAITPSFLDKFSPAFIRTSCIISALVILSSALSLFWVHSFLEQQRQTYGHNYGQALANVAAYQSQEATLDHDLLSLQIILQDIAKNPAVIGATIHDVENRLVVQGGHNPDTRRQLEREQILGSYNAPITLQESVAGYVTVVLALPKKTDTALFVKLALAPLLTLALALWLLHHYVYRSATSVVAVPIVTSNKNDAEEHSDIDSRTEHHSAYIDDNFNDIYPVKLHLKMHLLPRLKQQLNGKNYKQLLAQFERQIRGVCSLYSGEMIFAGHDELILRFSANSEADATFNALCSARLLQSLTLDGGINLGLSAYIEDGEQTLCEQLQSHTVEEALSISENLINPDISRRAQLDGQTFIELESPWKELLVKQQRQLQRLSEQ